MTPLRHQPPARRAPGGSDAEAILQRLPVAVLLVEADHTLGVVYANPAASRVLGYSASELASRRLDGLLAPGERERLAAILAESPATTGVLTLRSSWDLAGRAGQLQRFEVAPGRTPHGGHACLMLFQPAQAEGRPSEDRAADGRMPAFSFTALHDLKEPLHIIRGYLGILRSRLGSSLDPESHEFLEEAYDGTLRLQDVVLGLLELFRADAKGIAKEPVDLGPLVDEAWDGLRLKVQESQAHLERAALPTVLVDRFQVARAMQNLLSNAIKFKADRPPRVEVAAIEHPREWEVVVADNGIGIPGPELQRVLEPFHRLHSQDEYPGTGLGLSICKKVAEMHGGRLWLTSEPGEGTSVHMTFAKEA
jgi:signal transduction histidine kinase